MSANDKILRLKEVMEMTGGQSRMTIWRLEKKGRFPKRINLGGRAVGWRLSDIQKWISELK